MGWGEGRGFDGIGFWLRLVVRYFCGFLVVLSIYCEVGIIFGIKDVIVKEVGKDFVFFFISLRF